MKNINNFIVEHLEYSTFPINEKLRISSKTRIYNYRPKSKDELREILKERLSNDKDADLNDIDVSDITYMGGHLPDCGLFEGLDPHDIDVSEWDVSKVDDMNHMFCGCKNFTGKGLEKWDVSNVEYMNSMFEDCVKLKCDLGNWDVSKAEDMRSMFYGCIGFIGKGLENWDVSKVKTMEKMFKYCSNLCCKLNNWNVQNHTDIGSMFDKTPIGDEYPYPDWYE